MQVSQFRQSARRLFLEFNGQKYRSLFPFSTMQAKESSGVEIARCRVLRVITHQTPDV